MSREEIKGENYTIAFGVDRFSGAFVQLWENPACEQDGAIVEINSFGVQTHSPALELAPGVERFLDMTKSRFENYKARQPDQRPNIDEQVAIGLAQAVGGFQDISSDVYRVFGDDI
jgi:hypothetical protein